MCGVSTLQDKSMRAPQGVGLCPLFEIHPVSSGGSFRRDHVSLALFRIICGFARGIERVLTMVSLPFLGVPP